MRVLIVDDEPAARARLAALLEEFDDRIQIVGEAADGVTALAVAADQAPDVVLLDIEMAEVDGFDVARHLKAPRPLVIFQTAHHRRAAEAFDHAALDFIVKPVSRTRLALAIERARERLLSRGHWPAAPPDTFERLGASMGYQPAVPARLLVRFGAGHRLVPLTEIVRFRAEDGVVYVRVAQRETICDYTLAELERRLGGEFLRVNRSDLVRRGAIEGVRGPGDGSLVLTLHDGDLIKVSRRRAAEVRAWLEAG